MLLIILQNNSYRKFPLVFFLYFTRLLVLFIPSSKAQGNKNSYLIYQIINKNTYTEHQLYIVIIIKTKKIYKILIKR